MLPERRPSLDEVASGLGLHPLDLARMLGHRVELPADLRLSAGDPARIAAWAGVEHWWEGVVLPAEDPARSRALVTGALRRLVDKDAVGERGTRADNLLRGLGPADQARLRRAVNALVRARILVSRASWRGLCLSLDPSWRELGAALAHSGDWPWELEEALR